MFSKVLVSFYTPAGRSAAFLGLHISNRHWAISLFYLAFQVDAQWCFSVVFICMSLMTNDIEHLYMCLFACISVYLLW